MQFQLQNQRAARIRGKASGKACAVDPKPLAACCQKRQASPLPGRDPRLVHPFAQLLAHAPACRVETVSHEEVIHRLLNDERGSFNPVLLSCLFDLQSRIPDELEAALLPPPPKRI